MAYKDKPGLDPEFDQSLERLIADAKKAGFNISRGSGYRSPEQQKAIIDSYRGKPGYKVSYEGGVRRLKDGKQMVASMNGSQHGKGNAHDLKWGSPAAQKWAHQNAKNYGIHFPLSWENWHAEKIGARNKTGATPTVTFDKPTDPGIGLKYRNLDNFEKDLWLPNSKQSNRTFGADPQVAGTNDLSLGIPQTTPQQTQTMTPYKKQFKGLGDMIPYVSNLYAMNQKPAAIPHPFTEQGVHLQRVNFNNDRYEAAKDYRGTMLNADQTLDGNSAIAVKAYGLAQKFKQTSSINQAERNQNSQISNQETVYNQGVNTRNLQRVYDTNVANMDRQNRIMSANMANVANASDKYIAQQDEQAKADLEERALNIYASNDPYGTYARLKAKGAFRFGGQMPGRLLRTYKRI